MFYRKILAEIAYFSIRFTKRLFLMQDGTCRFQPTCSSYARESLATLPLYRAIPLILRRVAKCRPGGGFGFDPVVPNDHNFEEKK